MVQHWPEFQYSGQLTNVKSSVNLNVFLNRNSVLEPEYGGLPGSLR